MSFLNLTRRSFLKMCICAGTAVLAGVQTTAHAASQVKRLYSYMQDRIGGVYNADNKFVVRASQDNIQVQELYKNFLHEPGGHISHELLHMHFSDKSAPLVALQKDNKLENPGAKLFKGSSYPYEWVK